MPDLGVRLQLLIGTTLPVPAPYDVVDALLEVEVTNNDERRDGFQLTFSLGKKRTARDYLLLESGLLDPPNRVSILVIIQGLPQVLINGMITRHDFTASNGPGQSRLLVKGEDTGLQLDLKSKRDVHRNLSDSGIVQKIMLHYPEFTPVITPTTDMPTEVQRVVPQHETDLAFIQKLARRNSFVFFTEPTPLPGTSIAYWGPRDRPGLLPQRAITQNMGSETNVDQISFGFDGLGPVAPQVTISDPITKLDLPIPVPSLLQAPLSTQPTTPLRQQPVEDTANLDPIQAALRALMVASDSADAVDGTGELDAASYGGALRSRQQVGVRGTGVTHDGLYYVKTVTHRIKRGEYKQSFELKRGGRGALSPLVNP